MSVLLAPGFNASVASLHSPTNKQRWTPRSPADHQSWLHKRETAIYCFIRQIEWLWCSYKCKAYTNKRLTNNSNIAKNDSNQIYGVEHAAGSKNSPRQGYLQIGTKKSMFWRPSTPYDECVCVFSIFIVFHAHVYQQPDAWSLRSP